MANVKISQLPSATTPLGGTEVLPIVQGSTTKKVTVNELRATAVTAVTGTAPVVSSGGTTPAISMAAANGSTNGYLTSTDWTTFNSKQPAGSYLTNGGALGTPSSGTATNLTGLPLSTGVTGTLPIANGGTGQTTANAALNALLPSQSGNNGKVLSTDGTNTTWSTPGAGTVTSVDVSGGTTGLTTSGGPITSSGTVTLAGTLNVANGGTGTTTPSLVAGTNVTITGTWPNQTINSSGGGGGGMVYPGAGIPLSTGTAWGTSYSTTGTGDVVLSTSPTLVTPLLGTPTSGDFSTGTFTWPTFNQNTTGTAANITATSNSTLTTLSALSLPGSQVSGNISGNAANVTGTVAVANGGTGATSLTANNVLLGNGTSAVQVVAPGTTGNVLTSNGTTWVSSASAAGDVTLTGTQTLTNKTLAAATNIIEARSAPNATSFGFRNRIINGDMTIDQRNAGASVSIAFPSTNYFAVDRFQTRMDTSTGSTTQQSSVTPAGFTNSNLVTVGTGATPASGAFNYWGQRVEGFNMSDFGWGTASAQSVTLSFWVRSSLTGTFGISLRNASVDRSYVSSYVISTANTWEQKTITIAGDTGGTWNTSNGVGAFVFWDIGQGSSNSTSTTNTWQAANFSGLTGGVKLCQTSGATFYVTGVQLEGGSTATPFERRAYGTELALCQRYYEKSYDAGTVPGASVTGTYVGLYITALVYTSAYMAGVIQYKQTKRATPTFNYWDAAGNSGSYSTITGGGLARTDNVGALSAVYGGDAQFGFMSLPGTGNMAMLAWAASSEL